MESHATPSLWDRSRAAFRSATGIRLETVLIAAGVIAAIGLSPRLRGLEREGLMQLDELGAIAPLVLVSTYVLTTNLLLPAFPLDMAAGAHFDFGLGVLWVQVAATVASTSGFLIGRHLLRGPLTRLMKKRPRLQNLDQALEAEGWRIVFLARLSPLFPFGMLNLVFGSSRIPLPGYVLATFAGMIPGSALYVYAGIMAADLSGAPDQPARSTAQWTIEILGFVGTVVLVVYVARRAQKMLSGRLAPGS